MSVTFNKLISLLTESINNKPLIAIDIQPCYRKHCNNIMPRYIDFLNKRNGNTYVFFNDEYMGCDTLEDVQYYYLENGLKEDKINTINWRPKQYAFFRNWMDFGIDEHDIIQAIRYMVMNRIYDSRDISDEILAKLLHDDESFIKFAKDDIITIPDINIAELKHNSPCYLCGGGYDECLKEIRILLNTFNIKYKVINNLVY